MTIKPHIKSPLTEDQMYQLVVEVEQLGIQPLLISETGSMAWGTNVEDSDHDFTIVGHDVDYDYFRWPRDSFSGKMMFMGKECDVRVFSAQKFLRKLARSELVAYETIYTPFGYHDSTCNWRVHLQSVVDRCFDPREMYRSVIGSMHAVKHIDPAKRRRQTFRYMFIALQLRALSERRGGMPVVHIEQYHGVESRMEHIEEYATVMRLYDWAMQPETNQKEEDFAKWVWDQLVAFQFPKMVDFKQDEHREFLSGMLARLMGQPQTWAEQCEALER